MPAGRLGQAGSGLDACAWLAVSALSRLGCDLGIPPGTQMPFACACLGGLWVETLANAQRAPVPACTRPPTPPPDGLLLTHCHQGQTELWSRTCPQSTAVLHPAERHRPNLPSSLSGGYALSSQRGCRAELTVHLRGSTSHTQYAHGAVTHHDKSRIFLVVRHHPGDLRCASSPLGLSASLGGRED